MFTLFDVTPLMTAVAFLFFTALYAITIKYLERRLTLTQSALISVVAVAVSFVLFIAYYYLVKIPFGVSGGLDIGARILIWLGACTPLINRLARNRGIEKKGRYDVGEKATFLVAILSFPIGVAIAMYGR
jgi:hypothetical protein